MNRQENEEFTRLLRSAVAEAEELKSRPTQFKKMLDAYGGFETVKRVLESGKPSDGFTRLWELGRLELTCEAIIVETKWRRHFDDDVVARSEKLLRDMRYPFKRFERDAADGDSGDLQLAATASQADYPHSDESPLVPPSASDMRINVYFRTVCCMPLSPTHAGHGARRMNGPAGSSFDSGVWISLASMDFRSSVCWAPSVPIDQVGRSACVT